jgi:hypothetical protein
MVNGLDGKGRPGWLQNPELSVYITPCTGTWNALEKILPVIAVAAPGVFFDVILLNHVDAATRFRATQGICLFIKEEMQESYRDFARQANLDLRIMRARGRRTGVIDNE